MGESLLFLHELKIEQGILDLRPGALSTKLSLHIVCIALCKLSVLDLVANLIAILCMEKN